MRVSNQSVMLQAEKQLRGHGLEPRIATLLFQDMFKLYNVEYTLALSEPMNVAQKDLYETSLKRVLNGEPYQYVVGFAHFYDETFIVNEDVLIPRFETEELVALILEQEPLEGITIADIGTGSGAIGLSLAKHSKNHIYMSDKFQNALSVAEKNKNILNENNGPVDYLLGDIFEPYINYNINVDVLVSNPPYIDRSEVDVMSEDTFNYEPHSALFAEDDGLFYYKHMVSNLDKILNVGGRVYFEIGYRQGCVLREYIQSVWPSVDVKIIKDINNHDRIIYFQWEAL